MISNDKIMMIRLISHELADGDPVLPNPDAKHKILRVSMQGATWNPSNVLHLRGRGCQDTGANLDPNRLLQEVGSR